MNKTRLNPIRRFALLLVMVPLVSCATPQQPDTPAMTPEVIDPTPTAAVEVQPVPTIEPSTSEPAPDPSPDESNTPEISEQVPQGEWVQETFGDAWTIGYPAGWTVNAAGAHEGFVELQGEYAGHSYAVTYSYPIGILPGSLDEWLQGFLVPLTPEQQEALAVSDIVVANTPAKKVLNFPTAGGTTTAHHVYIWRTEAKNPRLITITQTDDQPLDAVVMEQLLDQLLAAITES